MYKNILNKILLSEKPSIGIYKLIETGEIREIIPELIKLKGFEQQTPYHDKDVLDHTMAVVDYIKPELHLRMAALLHDISKPSCFTIDAKGRGHFYGHHIKSADESEKILKRLGYEEDFINEVKIHSIGEERLDDMLELISADMAGKPDTGNLEVVQRLKDLSNEYLSNKDKEL